MKKISNGAFTLIELLVVITIIGILATGAVAVYTSQIQKGRDATRITSVNAMKGGIEQFYQDFGQYPNKGALVPSNDAKFSFSGVLQFVPNLPKDPKTGQSTTFTSFDYAYNVGSDSNGIESQIYEISTGLENSGNITSKAGTGADGGNDPYRLEIGVILADPSLDTNINGKQTLGWISTGNPTGNTCVTAGTATAGACASGNGSVFIIR